MGNNNYTSHSKFVYANYDAIQDAINNGIINANDIVICKDTKEMIIVREDLTLFPIKSKIYRFSSVEKALESLNSSLDTYAGQVIAVLDENGKYQLNIVNLNSDGQFDISEIQGGGVENYDDLDSRPIKNISGTSFNPLMLSSLDDGIYKVSGAYKVDNKLATVFIPSEGEMFIVSSNGNNKEIQKFSGSEIINFTVSEESVVKTVYLTEKWLEDNNYITKDYVDDLIKDLDLYTKEEIEQYIDEAIQNESLNYIQQTVKETIDGNFADAQDSEIDSLFTEKG